MRSNESLFLIAVFAIAAVFAALSLSNAWDAIGGEAGVEMGAHGSAGVPRDVNVERMERLIEEGRLSGREAEFYRRADEAPPEAPGTMPAE